MKKITLVVMFSAVMLAIIAAPASGLAQQRACTKDELQRAAEIYVTAQTKGDRSILPLVEGYGYMENIAPFDIAKGIINKPMKIDHQFTMYDIGTCQTFTELIVTDKAEPYVLGTRLRVYRDKIAELEIIWTTTGYWGFNADAYLKYVNMENWGEIPAAQRSSREHLVYAGSSYLDAFIDGNIDRVPWGQPCVRIEGGAYTGKGVPEDVCSPVPSDVNIGNRRYVVDETIGAVVVFCTFGMGTPGGESGRPDTHLFRVENGKLRYAHTLTHMLQSDFQPSKPKADGDGKPKSKP